MPDSQQPSHVWAVLLPDEPDGIYIFRDEETAMSFAGRFVDGNWRSVVSEEPILDTDPLTEGDRP